MVNIERNSLTRSLVAVGAVLALAACQGQNPFKRESNPVRNYPKVQDSILKHENVAPYGVKQQTLPEPDNNQYICSNPFDVRGERILTFMEDSSTAYQITIRNRLGDDFQATAESLPNKATFKLISKASAREAIYQIAWTPKIPTGESAIQSEIKIHMSSAEFNRRCPGDIAIERIALLAKKGTDRPIISIQGLPQTKATFGQDLPFTVEVSDRNADPATPPTLNGFEFSPQALNGEQTVIDGSLAVNKCDITPAYDESAKKFRFNCTFSSSLLEKGADKALIGSGQTADVVFFVTATSRKNGLDSNQARATITMDFPATQTSGGQK